jgi:hypothetical protein
MKMGKSRTKRKFVKKKSGSVIPRKITNATTDYIKQWTERELGKIQIESQPVCVPLKNGYLVGLYHLTINPNKTCDVLDPNKEFVHRFESKISAILYAIYISKRQYWRSDEILYWDKEVNKNYTDVASLRHAIDQAQKRKDYVIVDTRQARLEMAETRLNLAREHILKIHKTAKYYKVWL